MMHQPGTVTHLLRRLQTGDTSALEALMPLLYDELHLAARQRLIKERPGHTLGATALVNEVYLKLVKQKQIEASDKNNFMAIASRTMRNILVDYARTRNRAKRGSGVPPVPLDEVALFLSDKESEEVLMLDTALERLYQMNERASEVVQHRFFAGLTLDETAEVMGLSKRTVQRLWVVARAWLRKEIAREVSF